MATIKELLSQATKQLQGLSESPRLDVEVLLRFVLKCPLTFLIAHSEEEVNPTQEALFLQLLNRRRQQEPIAYIIGVQEFYSLDFKVTPAVLIPRPETELLVERAWHYLKDLPTGALVLDLGTGSGCIAICLATLAKAAGVQCQILAVDQSPAALQIAKENANTHNVSEYLQFIESNWYSEIDPRLQFDLVLSNPPYIAENDLRVSPETRYEPRTALYAGADGLRDLREILLGLSGFLKPNGIFLSEIGTEQGQDLISECQRLEKLRLMPAQKIELLSDYSERQRILKIRNINA